MTYWGFFGPEVVANMTLGPIIFLSMCQPSNYLSVPSAQWSEETLVSVWGGRDGRREREVWKNSEGGGCRVLRHFLEQTEKLLTRVEVSGRLWHLLPSSSLWKVADRCFWCCKWALGSWYKVWWLARRQTSTKIPSSMFIVRAVHTYVPSNLNRKTH